MDNLKKVIYVVDDTDTILAQTRELLKSQYTVRTFNSALSLIKMIENIPTPPDMLLLDIEMPDTSGTTALPKIRMIDGWQHIPVLLLTGWDTEEVLAHFFSQGVLDVVHKPIVPSVLMNRVAQYMRLIEFIGSR